MRHGGGAQRALPLTPNAQNVTLGEEGVHPHTTQIISNEKASIYF
jgi:hypothetical protein